MRARWSLNARAAALGLVVTALVLGPAAAVSATPPVTLGTGYVLDDVGILTTAEISAAEANLTEFRDESGLDLWVIFVDEFTDPSSSADWANQTALDNGLGPTQYLLAVATESRQLYLSGDSAGPVTDDQLAAIEQNDTQPALRDNDWLGAIDATAAGLGDAIGITTGRNGWRQYGWRQRNGWRQYGWRRARYIGRLGRLLRRPSPPRRRRGRRCRFRAGRLGAAAQAQAAHRCRRRGTRRVDRRARATGIRCPRRHR